MIRALAFLVLAGALAGYSLWIYLRAELPVRRVGVLAALRATTLVLLLALAFDVRLPWGGGDGGAQRWALLDVSASMGADDGEAWQGALARAQALEAEGWRVVPFGDAVGRSAGEAGAGPTASRSELEPALVRAAEAGASEVRVLSDLRFQDPVASAAALGALALDVTFEAFGGPVANAGIGELTVPDQPRRGDPLTAEVAYFAEGVTDSLQVEVREEGTLVASVAVSPPTPGRRGRAALALPPPAGEGRLRYTARIHLSGDAFPGDDEAVAYMNAGYEAGGLVVVSLRADWEPRAALTVLGESTGLPATGYLRVGPDRFVPMGRAVQRGGSVDSATVRRAATDAALLVLHGLDARTDAWGRSLARRGARVLLWPGDAVGADVAGVPAGAPLPGEWYAAVDVPASPVAADLAGARFQDLPPLSALLPLDAASASASPLRVQLGGTGPARAAMVLDEGRGGRRAVALSSGFWRWYARDGAPRDAYRRLLSGVAGWLLSGDDGSVATEVRPELWIAPPGDPVAWWVPDLAADTVRLEVVAGDGSVVTDTAVASGGRATTPPLPTGTYRYRALAEEGPVGEGRFDVDDRSEEMLPVPKAPEAPPAAARATGRSEAGLPLRATPFPYLLLLLLLSAEWVARRRAGLR